MSVVSTLRRPVLMIVDDDLDQLLLFRISAQRSNAYSEVITAEDGSTALDMLVTGLLPSGLPVAAPDIIVTDLKMPAMGGIDLARAVRANEATRHIAVVVLSSSAHPRDRQAAQAAGCRAFFQKPDELQRLVEMFATLPRVCEPKVKQAC